MISETRVPSFARAHDGKPRRHRQPVETVPAEASFYRDHTLVLLRRYFRLSLDMGRLPSVLGREIFRARVSVYKVHTFEDAVIFVHDVERCLERLDDYSKQLIARIVFQEYSEVETAQLLGRHRQRIVEGYVCALDHLTEMFLKTGLLRPLVRPE